LHLTQACMQSLRENTDVPYEIVLVDNGSAPEAAAYVKQAGDQVVLNEQNLGFAKGMNQGLALARGEYVAFLNNDTVLPPGWASRLLEVAHEEVGIVVPALTAAGNERTVRQQPGDAVETLRPFEAPPSAVLYVMRTDVVRQLEGWGEEYEVASAEEIDLCFKVWVNGLNIVYHQGVLVDHVGKGTVSAKLGDWSGRWAENRRQLFTKWTARDVAVPRLDTCPPEEFERNLEIARSVAGWMAQYFRARDRVPAAFFGRRVLRVARPAAARLSRLAYRWRHFSLVRRVLVWARRQPRYERMLRRLR
jgi:GT2 family glycosyltransferase